MKTKTEKKRKKTIAIGYDMGYDFKSIHELHTSSVLTGCIKLHRISFTAF